MRASQPETAPRVPVFAVGWSTVASWATVAGFLLVIGGGVATRTQRWRKAHRSETHETDLLHIAVFGRPAEGPLPAIAGLLRDHEATRVEVRALRADVDALSAGISTLLARTQENGGESIKDQLNRIEQHLGIADDDS